MKTSEDNSPTKPDALATEVLKENPWLHEALNSVQRMFDVEDQHWSNVFGGYEDVEGIGLEELHRMSESIREAMVKAPIIGRGANLKHSYVWGKGVNLPEPTAEPGSRGRKPALDRAMESPTNRRALFHSDAQEQNERALYSDGNLFLLGDNREKTLHRVPLSQIQGILTHPDYDEEIWAFRRDWSRRNAKGKSTILSRWYYTDDCPQPLTERPKSINGVPVDHSQTIFVHSVNQQVGWALGIPDAIAAVAWAKLYNEFLKHGYVMSKSLASIAFRATVGTAQGGKNAAMKLATQEGAGQTAVIGAANTLQALPTAGRGYDFDSGRPIAAQVATAVQVSIVHLLSDPGAAGSSYGSAANLDKPTSMAVLARQASWIGFYERVFKWIDPKVDESLIGFPPLEDADPLRSIQMLVQGFESGAIHFDEFRPRLLQLLSIPELHKKEPVGAMLPNNEKSLARSDVDQDGSGSDGEDGDSQNSNLSSSGRGQTSPLQVGRRTDSHDLDDGDLSQ